MQCLEVASGQKWTPTKNSGEYRGTRPAGNVEGKKSELFCKYCKKSGHMKEDCYKLVGYPAHFKFNKPRKGNFGNHQANAVVDQEFKTTTTTD